MYKQALVVVLLLVCAALFAQQTMMSDTALPVDPDLIIGKLSNGLTYYIKVNRKPEKRAELRLVTNIGSVQEDDDQQGLAHFTEHMAFNGTKHFKKQELVDYLNSIGMGFANGLNAATGLDQTVYQLEIPTDDTAIMNKGFLILSDWAAGVSLDADEVDRERGVIIEEWRGGQGADQRMYDATRKVMFAGSKYAERMPIGKLEVLQNFTPDTIRRFYNDWYRPDLQAIVAVGDFDPIAVENLIKEYFEPIMLKPNPREVILYDVPDHAEPKVVISTDPEAADTGIQLTWKHDRTQNKSVADYRKSLVTNLYTGMLNERLQELSQKPEPPFSYAFNYSFNMVRSKSTYAMVAQVPETGIMTGLTALLTEAERVSRFGFTQSELDRAKLGAMRSAERMLAEKDKQESGRLVWRYVGSFTYGNPVMSVEQNVMLNRELYAGISLEDVNRMCRELVTDNNLVIAVTAPQKPDLTMPTEQDLLNLRQQVKSQILTAYEDKVSDTALLSKVLKPGKIISKKAFKKVGVKQWTLSNGITVLYKQTDYKNDEVLLKAYSPGGGSLYPNEDLYDLQVSAGVIMESGLADMDATELNKKLTGKIANVNPFIGDDREGFDATCSVADMETMFQLVYLYATEPRLTEDSYSSWLSRTTAGMQNEALNPEKCFGDSVALFTVGYNPRNKSMQAEDLATIDPNRIMQIYKERFADFTDFTFVFVGNFDEKLLKEYCVKYLANLPAMGVREQVKDNNVRIPAGKKDLNVYMGQDPKGIVLLVSNRYEQIDAMTGIKLQNLNVLMNEKLRENIRETRSGVYFVGAWVESFQYPNPQYMLNVYLQCAPERVQELTDATLSTLDSLKAGMIDEKYVNVVRMTREKLFETDTKDNRWWLRTLSEQAWKGFPLNAILEDREQAQQLTLKELQDTAGKYLSHDVSLLKCVLYPEAMKP
jgi:zinc protease